MIDSSTTDAPTETMIFRHRLPHRSRRSLAGRTVRPAIIDPAGLPSAKPLFVGEAEVSLQRARACAPAVRRSIRLRCSPDADCSCHAFADSDLVAAGGGMASAGSAGASDQSLHDVGAELGGILLAELETEPCSVGPRRLNARRVVRRTVRCHDRRREGHRRATSVDDLVRDVVDVSAKGPTSPRSIVRQCCIQLGISCGA